MAVSGTFFDAIGVRPALGRTFGVEEDRVAGRNPVVVLDHDLWATRFVVRSRRRRPRRSASAATDVTVIGVMPDGFTGPDQFVKPAFYRSGRHAARDPDRRSRRSVDAPRPAELRRSRDASRPVSQLAQATQEIDAARGQPSGAHHPDTNRDLGMSVHARSSMSRVEASARSYLVMVMHADAVSRPGAARGVRQPGRASLQPRPGARARAGPAHGARCGARAPDAADDRREPAARRRRCRRSASGSAYAYPALFQQLSLPTDVPLKLEFGLDARAVGVGIAVAARERHPLHLLPAWRSTRADLVTTLKNSTAAGHRTLAALGPPSARLRVRWRWRSCCSRRRSFLYRAFDLEQRARTGLPHRSHPA